MIRQIGEEFPDREKGFLIAVHDLVDQAGNLPMHIRPAKLLQRSRLPDRARRDVRAGDRQNGTTAHDRKIGQHTGERTAAIGQTQHPGRRRNDAAAEIAARLAPGPDPGGPHDIGQPTTAAFHQIDERMTVFHAQVSDMIVFFKLDPAGRGGNGREIRRIDPHHPPIDRAETAHGGISGRPVPHVRVYAGCEKPELLEAAVFDQRRYPLPGIQDPALFTRREMTRRAHGLGLALALFKFGQFFLEAHAFPLFLSFLSDIALNRDGPIQAQLQTINKGYLHLSVSGQN